MGTGTLSCRNRRSDNRTEVLCGEEQILSLFLYRKNLCRKSFRKVHNAKILILFRQNLFDFLGLLQADLHLLSVLRLNFLFYAVHFSDKGNIHCIQHLYKRYHSGIILFIILLQKRLGFFNDRLLLQGKQLHLCALLEGSLRIFRGNRHILIRHGKGTGLHVLSRFFPRFFRRLICSFFRSLFLFTFLCRSILLLCYSSVRIFLFLSCLFPGRCIFRGCLLHFSGLCRLFACFSGSLCSICS